MAQDDSSVIIIAIAAVIALVGVGLAASSVATQRSFGGMWGDGMMGENHVTTPDPGPGGIEWGILVASAVLFIGALFVYYRGRSAGRLRASDSTFAPTPSNAVVAPPAAFPPAREEPVPEPTLIKLLDEDERRMYLEIREHGGEMFQRDLVALGTFSKAKVTRVLDKLETKGLVVRERHGMTNRVRLVTRAAK